MNTIAEVKETESSPKMSGSFIGLVLRRTIVIGECKISIQTHPLYTSSRAVTQKDTRIGGVVVAEEMVPPPGTERVGVLVRIFPRSRYALHANTTLICSTLQLHPSYPTCMHLSQHEICVYRTLEA